MPYDPSPRYPVAGGAVELGYEPLAAEASERAPAVLAVDGPAALPWDELVPSLLTALSARGTRAQAVDVRSLHPAWSEVERRTASALLPGDPVFGRVFEGSLAGLFDELPPPPRSTGVTIVFGPGSALLAHDLLWYADLPKALSLERIRDGRAANVGQPAGEAGSEQRLLFVDWPLLDRHKQELLARVDRFVDASDPGRPRSLDGEALRRSLHALAGRPFRVRPTFLPGPWGGQWLRRELGIETDAQNLAWSYELITPESGILLGAEEPLEVGFELLIGSERERLLGRELAARFGKSFPVRFDYLDTLEGGPLSIQCHPSDDYMREVFGLPYTQHETYYVMATTPAAKIFLGLHEDADPTGFRVEAEAAERWGRAFDPERYLQAQPAAEHQLYLIPGGTPHASGAGNVVLEISATPYLYTLRFYDWLRRSLDGELRPVHLAHAFANVDASRRGGTARRELVPEPAILERGTGWAELRLGSHPDLFFAVHRLDFENGVEGDTEDRFHVLNLVAGDEISIETGAGAHALSYAETIVVPAAVGPYRLRRERGPACKVVKAFVP